MDSMPLEFLFAISGHESAMRNFLALDDRERMTVLARARSCKTGEETMAVAMSLSDDTDSAEYY